MNLFILVFLSLGAAIGTFLCIKSSVKNFKNGILDTIFGGELSLLGSGGGGSKAKILEDKPKAQDPMNTGNGQSQPFSPQPAYSNNNTNNFNFNSATQMASRINMSGGGNAGGGGGTSVGGGIVVGLVNAVGLMNQSGQVRNIGRQINGFVNQMGQIYTRQIRGGRKPIMINQMNSQIWNQVKGGKGNVTINAKGSTVAQIAAKKASIKETGPTATYITGNEKLRLRLHSEAGNNEIKDNKISRIDKIKIKKPKGAIFLGEGQRKFTMSKGALPAGGSSTANGIRLAGGNSPDGSIAATVGDIVHNEHLANGDMGPIILIGYPSRALSGKQFSGMSMPMFRDPENSSLGIKELARLYSVNQALMSGQQGILGTEQGAVYAQMMRSREFGQLMRTMVELNPSADAISQANIFMMMSRIMNDEMNKRHQPIALGDPNARRDRANHAGVADNLSPSAMNRLRLKEEQEAAGKALPASQKTEEAAREEARKNVRESSENAELGGERHTTEQVDENPENEKIKTATRVILQDSVELTDDEKARIAEKARSLVKVKKGMSQSEIEKKVGKKEEQLIKKAKEEKIRTAKTELQRAISDNEEGVKLILGDSDFNRIVERIKQIDDEQKKDEQKKARRGRNRQVVAAQKLMEKNEQQRQQPESGSDNTSSGEAVETIRPLRVQNDVTSYRKDNTDGNGSKKE